METSIQAVVPVSISPPACAKAGGADSIATAVSPAARRASLIKAAFPLRFV